MFNYVLTGVAIFVVVVGVVATRFNLVSGISKGEGASVLSQSVVEDGNKSPQSTETDPPAQTETPAASPSPSSAPKTATPKPVNQPVVNTQRQEMPATNQGEWLYPGSVKNADGSFYSSESAGQVTQWYKEKIKSKSMRTTSIIETRTNNKVYNKISALSSNEEVSLEITSTDGQGSQIKVEIKNKEIVS